MSQESINDPLEFVRSMWKGMGFNLPGMVTPTVDVDELDKRIADMKAVEGWLKMNLNMLQMTIQGLEMQRATLMTIRHMGEAARRQSEDAEPADEVPPNPFTAFAWMQGAGARTPDDADPEGGAEVNSDSADDEADAADEAAAREATAAAAANAANAFANAAAAATNAAMWPWQLMEQAGKDEPRTTKTGAARKPAAKKPATRRKPAAKKPAAATTKRAPAKSASSSAAKPASTAKRKPATTSRARTPKKD